MILCAAFLLVLATCASAGQQPVMVSEVSTKLESSDTGIQFVPVYQHGFCRHFGDIAIADILSAVNLLADRLVEGETITLIENYRVYPEHMLKGQESWKREWFGVTVCPSGKSTEYCWGDTATFFFRFVDGQVEMSELVEMRTS
jgi:hypothetical protein